MRFFCRFTTISDIIICSIVIIKILFSRLLKYKLVAVLPLKKNALLFSIVITQLTHYRTFCNTFRMFEYPSVLFLCQGNPHFPHSAHK